MIPALIVIYFAGVVVMTWAFTRSWYWSWHHDQYNGEDLAACALFGLLCGFVWPLILIGLGIRSLSRSGVLVRMIPPTRSAKQRMLEARIAQLEKELDVSHR